MKEEELLRRIQVLEEQMEAMNRRPSYTKWMPIVQKYKLLLLSLLFIPFGILLAANITKPHTFTSGEKVSASKVNENFDTLYAKVNDLDTRMTAAEASITATVGKSWRLIYEKDMTAATQTVDITGLNGDVDMEYELSVRFVSGGTGSYLILLPNNDTNAANYVMRGVNAVNNGAGQGNGDANNYGGAFVVYGGSNGDRSQGKTYLYAKSGQMRIVLSQTMTSISSATAIGLYGTAWLDTSSNITSLTVKSTVANGIGAGTHIELWARR